VGETRANGGGAARDEEDRRRSKASTQEEVGVAHSPFHETGSHDRAVLLQIQTYINIDQIYLILKLFETYTSEI
jgi:hypothetical protein